MINDPIVEEVRKAADRIMAKTNYDPIKYFRLLQSNEIKSNKELVDFSTNKRIPLRTSKRKTLIHK